MKKITDKIEKVLAVKFPDAAERAEIIAKAGQVILLETTEQILTQLNSEEDRKLFGEFLNQGRVEEAIDFAAKKDIKTEEIMEQVSASVVTDLFS